MSDLNLKTLWQQEEPAPRPGLDLEAIQARAAQLEVRVRRRNRLEWLAGGFVFLWFGAQALMADSPLLLMGHAMIALAAVGLSLYLWRYGQISADTALSLDADAYAEAHAQTLDAQARLMAQAPLWYVAPLAAGMAVRMSATMPPDGENRLPWALTLALVVAVFIWVAWYNLRGARALRQEAAELRAEREAIRVTTNST